MAIKIYYFLMFLVVLLFFLLNIYFFYTPPVHASELLELTNKDRVQNGLKPLTENIYLDESAQEKANDLCKTNVFSHSNSYGNDIGYFVEHTRYQKPFFKYSFAENIARNYYNNAELEQAFMNSPEHRENILNPNYKDFGTARCGKYVVVHFAGWRPFYEK